MKTGKSVTPQGVSQFYFKMSVKLASNSAVKF